MFVDGRWEAVFSRLRESDTLALDGNCPVPIYSLVRYADVERAYKEPELFSPCAGLTLDAFDPGGCERPSRMLETARPELHRELRGAMQGAFRGGALAAVRTGTEERLERFLDGAVGDGAVEFVTGFAREAGRAMMSELLGISANDAKRLGPALDAIGEIDFGTSVESAGRRQKTEMRLLRDLTRVVRAERAAGSSRGLIGMLLAAEVEGAALSDAEVALNCFNVAVAGTGASQHTLAGAVAVWAEHPGCVDAVATEPKLARGLIEETLRWLTPVIHLTRILTADTEIAGQELPKGAGICLWNLSANRDERVFEDAASFRPDRPPARNLAFGAGAQYCLGVEVIRTQLDALLSGLIHHRARPELAAPPTWMPSNAIAGVGSLPLRIVRS